MEPLYYQTPYVKEFDAIVTACRPAKPWGVSARPDFTRRAADSRRTPDRSGKCM